MIFVFGSNLAGRHGAGAARTAHELHGAKYGVGIGLEGNSYALPTKNEFIKNLSFGVIKRHVDDFIKFAKQNPTLQFQVTRVGCGLARMSDSTMSVLFKDAPDNCYFDEAWKPFLGDQHKYWGTFDNGTKQLDY